MPFDLYPLISSSPQPLTTTILFSVSIKLVLLCCCFFKIPHISDSFVFLCLTSFPFSIKSSRFVHLVTGGSISFFLWLGDIPLSINTAFSLSIHWLKDTYVVSICWLLWVALHEHGVLTESEMEQDAMVLPHPSSHPAFCLWKNFRQKIIGEVRKCRNEGKQSKETI